MPISREFLDQCQRLFEPAMGTEAAAFALYGLVRMVRPRTVLEVGLGYTTPFLAMALADCRAEFEADRALLAAHDRDRDRDRDGHGQRDEARLQVLIPPFYEKDYRPRLIAIDDFSLDGSSAPQALEVLKDLELDGLVQVHEGNFRGHSKRLAPEELPLDFVWFDCGGPRDYLDFIGEYWPLINADHGLLALHFTYWTVEMRRGGETLPAMISSPIIDEIKRQQAIGGIAARFEMLSLLEPHKSRQGSVTLVRKLAPQSLCRNRDFATEMTRLFGRKCPAFPDLG